MSLSHRNREKLLLVRLAAALITNLEPHLKGAVESDSAPSAY